MSRLVRAGVVLSVLGLSLAALWAVAFGAVTASTEVHCPGATPDYAVESVDPRTGTLVVDDGCNVHRVAGAVVGGLSAAVVGVAVGGAGLAAGAVGARRRG